MTSKGAIDCRFYLDGAMLTERAWHTIPSRDEIVMLPEAPGSKAIAFNVIGRVFLGDGGRHNRQLVYLYLERLKT